MKNRESAAPSVPMVLRIEDDEAMDYGVDTRRGESMRPPLGMLRAALAIALEEKMLDGQDLGVLLEHCTRACLDASALLELELRVRATGSCSWVETREGQAQQRHVFSPTTEWPVLAPPGPRIHESVPHRARAEEVIVCNEGGGVVCVLRQVMNCCYAEHVLQRLALQNVLSITTIHNQRPPGTPHIQKYS